MTTRTLGTAALCLSLLVLPSLGWSAEPAAEEGDAMFADVDWQGMALTPQGQADWPSHAATTIDIAGIPTGDPTLDGSDADEVWSSVSPQAIELAPANGMGEGRTGTLRAFHNGTILYFLVTWQDTTYNETPQQWVWNGTKYRYDLAPDAEDRCTFLFKHYGDFRGDVLAGAGYAADMWRWGAGTTNPGGYADDLWRAVLRSPQEDLPSVKVGKGDAARYVSTESDEGLLGHYLMPAPEKYAGDRLYAEASREPVNSAGDVRARATFTRDQGWMLEIARHMQTYADDDLQINPNSSIELSLSVIDGATGQKFVTAPLRIHLLG